MQILASVANIIRYISALAGIFSAVAVMIQAVESPGNGEQKKKAVLDGIGAIYDAAAEWLAPIMSKERVLQVAGVFIDVLVALYNAVGVFRKGGTPTTTSALGNS